MKFKTFHFMSVPAALFSAFSFAARATDLDDEYLRRLSQVSRADSVVRLEAEYENLRVLRTACALEHANHLAPISCYKEARARLNWKMLSTADLAREFAVLDRQCQSAALRLRLPRPGRDLSATSKVCRDKIRYGWDVESYRQDGRFSPGSQ